MLVCLLNSKVIYPFPFELLELSFCNPFKVEKLASNLEVMSRSKVYDEAFAKL